MQEEMLRGVAGRYREAVGANDARMLPLARSVRYTENAQDLAVTRGAWLTTTAPPTPYLTVVDPVAGQVICVGALPTGQDRAIYGTRLRVDHDLVTEIETLLAPARTPRRQDGAANMTEPRAVFTDTVPTERRVSRERLAQIAHLYFDGVQSDDGSIIPAAPDCTRRENGIQAVPTDKDNPIRDMLIEQGLPEEHFALGMSERISTGIYTYINRINNRRIIAIDEERQVVAAWVIFHHRGEVAAMPELGMDELPDVMRLPSSFLVIEWFKVDAGEITAIEAIGEFVPLGMPAGWPTDPVHHTESVLA